ncbi:MAG: hypothetical protein VX152_11900 [Pseudomonadota bacterium]|nr:hypothetical protein [Pseudomonadota bacterium]
MLGVEPWSGPRRGATLVRVRARGSLPSRAACRFGGDAVAAALASSASASGGRSPSRVGGASRVVCASAPSASTGWVGVRVVGSYGGAVSSGGGFYYHRRVRVRGAAPPLDEDAVPELHDANAEMALRRGALLPLLWHGIKQPSAAIRALAAREGGGSAPPDPPSPPPPSARARGRSLRPRSARAGEPSARCPRHVGRPRYCLVSRSRWQESAEWP